MRLGTKRTAISIFVLIAFIGGTWASTFTAATLQPTNPQKKQFKPQKREKQPHQREGKGFKVKKGSEVAGKVRKLKDSNKDVRAALKLFEDKKRTPKVDSSFSLSGALGSSKSALNNLGRPFRSTLSFAQQSALAGTNVEIIFVPVLSLAMEWHGTIISDIYDNVGNLVGEYVAESVLVMPEPNLYAWDEIYEAPVYNGFVGPAIAGSGLFTNVELGVPLDQQVISMQMNQANPPGVLPVVPVSYVQGGPARLQAWLNCTFGWCGAAGMNCVGTDLWSADVLNSSCFASGCGNDALGCAWGTIWQ